MQKREKTKNDEKTGENRGENEVRCKYYPAPYHEERG
jgi:hypothetical protein